MSDFTEKNRQYFDKMATTYIDEFKEFVDANSREVLNRRAWISDTWTDTESGKGKVIKMLEYACGPGPISMALAPFLTKIVGMDVSDGMVSEFNRNAQEAGLGAKMTGVKADLLAETGSEELSAAEYNNFDLVVVSMALHHFETPELALVRLGERLKKGGALMVLDILAQGYHDHHHHHHHHDEHHGEHHDSTHQKLDFGEAEHTIGSHGFTLERIQQLYENAGLGLNFQSELLEHKMAFKIHEKLPKTLFLARGQRC
ncbi:class I SAM-dependent methyltransferase [Aspergillus saccharolyticus JOP 1030-1]|uniref:S-adenosyl-L-methionine-dependent methyltransferase n=1 Tax=Aspergillus saccharolyticus JOP 1030-1 TaxID=1450539 RepID=A0A318ZH26_9EURO|nr:S-adenosyl-L-methionine-dependent methyltransferase [Aspergillus saccharolyticus JOP 1030-1]PYH46861.1 S-adenosyl-L-methionine-dependent methyltransferase [Aspergillus saccharolyticus JOP 1030-1]